MTNRQKMLAGVADRLSTSISRMWVGLRSKPWTGRHTDGRKNQDVVEYNKADIKREVIIELLLDDMFFCSLESSIETFHPGWDRETVHAQAAAMVKEWVAEGVIDAGTWDRDAQRFKPWNLGPDETRRRILDELEKLESDILHPGDVCYLLETDRTFDYVIQNYPEDWERFLLSGMEFFGDKNLQKSVWMPEDWEPYSPKCDFEDLLNKYKFEDYLSGDGFHLSEQQKALGDELYGRIKDFYDQRHSVLTDPEKILSDPEWDIITEKAKKFVSLFPSDRVNIYAGLGYVSVSVSDAGVVDRLSTFISRTWFGLRSKP